MYSRALLSVACRRATGAAVNTRVPARGKALANWTRPKLDEYGTPRDPWAARYARNQTIYNMQLAGGIAFLIFTLSCAKMMDTFQLNTTPWHLLPEMRATVAEDP